MHLSQLAGHSSRNRKNRAASRAIWCAVDPLEMRRLFAGETVATAISPVLANLSNPNANSITLDQHFNDATIPGTLVTFNTSLGQITVALTDTATPLTVANFLSYVSSGAYADTIFHRAALLGSTSGPNDIIQGGGYTVSGAAFPHIPTSAPVDDEYTSELFGDVAGTLAMAKTASANSATSEWYFNVHNNTSALDTPTTDSSGTSTSYTAFGKVLTGLKVVDEIAALPTYNVSSTLSTVPVVGINANEAKVKLPITAANLVYTDSISSQPGTTYTITSDNNSLVTPSITNGVLSFKYASGIFGTARITVLAKNLDGTTASTTFTVTVPNTATPSAGPTAAAVTAPNVVAGASGTFSVLGDATDSVAALNASSVAIVTQPTHGAASVNASTGLITYTPDAGYTGSDTLTYTVADTAGATSSAAAVTINVVAAPITVTIGTRTARTLKFTQPNGIVGTLTVKGGTAVITFASSAVTTSTAGGITTATGAGATLDSIVITDTSAAASLTLDSTGPVSIGSISDASAVSNFTAPLATLLGDATFGSIRSLVLNGAVNSLLTLGSNAATSLIVLDATNSSVTSTGGIDSIQSGSWLNSDGGYYSIRTPRLQRLKVTGTFADALTVTSANSSLVSSTVGQASSSWTVAGAMGKTVFTSVASTWSLNTSGNISSLTIGGNLASNISAGSIGPLTVAGTTNGSNITTTTATGGIARLQLGGAVTNSLVTVESGGKIGSVTTPSLNNSNISAGSLGPVTVSGNATTAQFIANGSETFGTISRFKIGGNFNGSTMTAAGAVGPLIAASMNNATIKAGTISYVVISGDSTSTTFTTNSNASGGKQIGSFRAGAFNSSAIATTGNLGPITVASISGSQFTAGTISSATVKGITNDGTFTTDAGFSKKGVQIGRLVFGGAVQGSMVNSARNIGTVTAPSFTGVQVYAGVNSAETEAAELPTGTSQFNSDAHIAAVVLGKTGTTFANSLISADSIGVVRLGTINTSNNGVNEGIATAKLSVFAGTFSSGGTLNAGPKQLKSQTALKAYETARKVTLGDFIITLF